MYGECQFNSSVGARIASAGQIFPIEANRLFLLPAEVPFDFGLEAGATIARHFYVHFDIVGVTGFCLRQCFDAPTSLSPNAPLETLAAQLSVEVEDAGADVSPNADMVPDDFGRELRLQSVIAGALGAAWESLDLEQRERGALFSARHEAMIPALRHIEAHLSEPLRNDELAALCHLSRDHFIRRFREATRRSPQSYVLERRVALAAQKLLFSDDSIEQIAGDCGFANRFYFSRMFARTMETSPAAFCRDGKRAYPWKPRR